MSRSLRAIAVTAVVALVAVACSNTSTTTATSGPTAAPQKGGTLSIVMNSDVTHTMDPQIEYYQLPFAFLRCCLQRTLFAYNGLDAEHDGTKVFPDLAAAEPTVSADGLTYTIPIKQGLMYGPPLEDVEITAQDFITPIERGYTVGGPYMGYYDIIEGATEYAAGDADHITGMTAEDDYTLQITLTGPVGDFNYRFAMAATGPIPPNPGNPDAKFGVAEGHDDSYGPFLVATGPYMFDGSGDLDFSVDPKDQEAVSGYRTGRSMVFVRNPSWAQDDLRKAYVDEIDIDIQPGADGAVLEKEVINDEVDTVFANGVSPATLQSFQNDPELQDQIFYNPSYGNYYLSMNVAVPPFDDVHVRRAVNFAVNKEGWRRFSGGEVSGTIATHYTPDALLDGLLADYDPFATPNNAGADSPEGLASAMEEMKLAPQYDTDGDGLCDAPACEGVLAVGVVGTQSEAADALIAANLEKIGIKLDLKSLENAAAYNKIFDPAAHVALTTFSGWLMDYPDAYTFYWFTNYGGNILDQYNTNYTLMGATPEQLQKYGYDVTEVAGMDDKIDECIATAGDARVQCWADADKILAEEVVSYVPLVISQNVNIVSSCVTNYQWSVFDSGTAFEQVAKIPGCGQ